MYSRLVAFKTEHGHTRVPETHPDMKLVNWVGNQRKARSRQQRGLPSSGLDQRRIALLNKLGFEWARARTTAPKTEEDQRMSWDDLFEKLCQFKELYGHTRVPANFDTRLANWVRNQRTAMSRKQRGLPYRCLNPHRIEQLQSIGFAWVASKDGGNSGGGGGGSGGLGGPVDVDEPHESGTGNNHNNGGGGGGDDDDVETSGGAARRDSGSGRPNTMSV